MNALGNKEIMAANIKYFMREKNVTATDICHALGFKHPTFSDWVHAKTYPRIDKIEMMANYFGVSKAALVEERRQTTRNELETLFNQLTEEQARTVLSVVQQMLAAVRKE